MHRSLTVKLTLAFLLVSLIGVILVAVFSRAITEREFDRLALRQAQNRFVEDVTTYYQYYGSWQGVDEALRHRPPPTPQPGQKPPLFLPSRLRFGLTDRQGTVVIPGGPYQVGDRASAAVLAQGTPLEVDGQEVGTIFFTNTPPPRDPLEEQYLARINQALLIAAGTATLVALVLGVFLARALTRPLREITTATQAVAKGDLAQAVPVRSEDEVGQLAESFNRMSADLARVTQLRRQMTADIAHDLRTPLTVISGYLEALRDGDLQPTPARFEAMHDEAQHLKRLVQDLRTLSLADAGELPLNLEPVLVPDLLARVAAAFRHQAQQQQVDIRLEPQAGLPRLQADSERLVQVLGNLVSNALRYTPQGGEIILSVQTRAEGLLLTVRDTGSGIASDELPHIFNRFYRADKSRRQEEGESGLGLAIARAIVHAHHGTIRAESEMGQGTAIHIQLPLEN